MPSLAPPRAHEPSYPPYPPQPPRPGTDPRLREVHVTPPVVYVESTFEYRQLSRPLTEGGAPFAEAELDELGRDGWELVGTVSDGRTAHFYFKRLGR
jgi:hypothetical protein